MRCFAAQETWVPSPKADGRGGRFGLEQPGCPDVAAGSAGRRDVRASPEVDVTTRTADTEVTVVDDAAVADEEAVLRWFSEIGGDPEARDRIALRYQPLATYLAKRFAGRGEIFEDLVQIANVGLMNAIDRFDPERGVRFSTYAAATIVGELKRHFRDRRWSMRVPRRLQDIAVRITQTLPGLTQTLGRSPTVAELGTALDVSEEEVIEAMEASYAYTASSLDSPAREDGATPMQTLGDVDGRYETLDMWVSLAPAIRSLSERNRHILYLRFFKGMKQTEIASEVGISQMQVSRVLSQTLERLRTAVDEGSAGTDDGPL
jgi:RNA polymerase sigma-B factor